MIERPWQSERRRRKERNRQIASAVFWLVILILMLGVAGEEDRKDKVEVSKDIERLTYQKQPLHFVEVRQLMGRW